LSIEEGRVRRRDFLNTLAVGGVVIGVGPHEKALAATQQNTSGLDAREIGDIFSEAGPLLGTQAAAAGTPKGPLDLAEVVLKALDKGVEDEKAASLAVQAGLLLSEINQNQRDVRIFAGDIASAASGYSYASLKPSYLNLMKNYTGPTPSRKPELARAAGIINSPSAKQRYIEVSDLTSAKIPWYVIGALHYREANLNFMGHLHNGDPLLTKTYHIPQGRPSGRWPPLDSTGKVIADPRILWRLSALDALSGMVFAPVGWTAAGTCYSLEAYNGFGFHNHHVNSPYLWNYSLYYNHPTAYPAGGYKSDGSWSSSYVSKQAGLIPLIGNIMASDSDFHWDLTA
jgi:lysozyme family protein